MGDDNEGQATEAKTETTEFASEVVTSAPDQAQEAVRTEATVVESESVREDSEDSVSEEE